MSEEPVEEFAARVNTREVLQLIAERVAARGGDLSQAFAMLVNDPPPHARRNQLLDQIADAFVSISQIRSPPVIAPPSCRVHFVWVSKEDLSRPCTPEERSADKAQEVVIVSYHGEADLSVADPGLELWAARNNLVTVNVRAVFATNPERLLHPSQLGRNFFVFVRKT